ncbi:MAG: hypothetical protein ACM3U2_03020 [Deltaproteobacteria bacterium]
MRFASPARDGRESEELAGGGGSGIAGSGSAAGTGGGDAERGFETGPSGRGQL